MHLTFEKATHTLLQRLDLQEITIGELKAWDDREPNPIYVMTPDNLNRQVGRLAYEYGLNLHEVGAPFVQRFAERLHAERVVMAARAVSLAGQELGEPETPYPVNYVACPCGGLHGVFYHEAKKWHSVGKISSFEAAFSVMLGLMDDNLLSADNAVYALRQVLQAELPKQGPILNPNAPPSQDNGMLLMITHSQGPAASAAGRIALHGSRPRELALTRYGFQVFRSFLPADDELCHLPLIIIFIRRSD